MVSEEKIASFLKLQQIALDIEESTKLLEQFLPIVLEELNLVGCPYVFLSSIFLDDSGNVKQSFFTDYTNKPTPQVTNIQNIFQKGSEWELKVMYGEAAVVSDVAYFINSTYKDFSKIKSLVFLPIQHAKKLSGILILASSKTANQVDAEEIEFGEMITRLINLSYRLQDTEGSLTKITQQVYEMNAKLHQLDKLKDDFVSIASHELRTPMTAIRSYAWMALHKADTPLSDKVEKYIVRVLISTERLINLVGNSLKFTPVDGKITFDFFTDGKVVEVSVKDSGVGISKEDLPKLFHKFSRLDSSYTAISTSGGTGLGLFISKSLVELMHGKIWAESEGSGKGTTMTISLPIATAEVIANANKFTIKPQGEVKGLEPVAI